MTVLAPLAVIYGMTAGLGWLALAIAIAVYLTAKFGGWMPVRGAIMAKGVVDVNGNGPDPAMQGKA